MRVTSGLGAGSVCILHCADVDSAGIATEHWTSCGSNGLDPRRHMEHGAARDNLFIYPNKQLLVVSPR